MEIVGLLPDLAISRNFVTEKALEDVQPQQKILRQKRTRIFWLN